MLTRREENSVSSAAIGDPVSLLGRAHNTNTSNNQKMTTSTTEQITATSTTEQITATPTTPGSPSTPVFCTTRASELGFVILVFVGIEFLLFLAFVFDLCFDSCTRTPQELRVGGTLMSLVLIAFVCYIIRYIYVSLTLYDRYLRDEKDETGPPSQPLLEAEQRDPA